VPQIYFEGFSIWADYYCIKASFNKFGSVLKLYVFRRVNKSGSLFGFVTITSNFSDKVLLESMNDIWFECHRLKANFARHSKKIPRENKTLDRSKPKTTIRVSISERDVRSYKEVLSEGKEVLSEGKTEQTHLPVASGPEDYFEKLSLDIEEEDYAWLKRCLLGKIKKRSNYSSICFGLLQHDIDFAGLCFLGASQVLIIFYTRDMLMESLRKNNECWDVFFEEVRPWVKTDTTLNRMACITITNLPIIGWNCRCLTKILERTVQMIGYDKTTLKHFELSQLQILIGTQLDKVNKVIVLQLNNQTYQVKIEEMDHLHYPIAGSISYTMDDFQTSLEQGDGDDEEDLVDMADDVDTDEDIAGVSPSVTMTLGGGSKQRMETSYHLLMIALLSYLMLFILMRCKINMLLHLQRDFQKLQHTIFLFLTAAI
jgi:hypothetical protein